MGKMPECGSPVSGKARLLPNGLRVAKEEFVGRLLVFGRLGGRGWANGKPRSKTLDLSSLEAADEIGQRIFKHGLVT